ncbi:porin family protein, partial [Streptomyces niveiscabiei]|uniref:hypothetical protein n=1 Tax=Streptomyces niveiscabiei TaxID=164115 RepID=UPI0038F7ECF2
KNIQIQIPQNYFDKTKIGISLYKFFQPKKWLDIIWQNDFFIESFSSHDPAITNLSGFGASLSLYNIYYLSTSKKLQLFNYIQEYVPGFYDYR